MTRAAWSIGVAFVALATLGIGILVLTRERGDEPRSDVKAPEYDAAVHIVTTVATDAPPPSRLPIDSALAAVNEAAANEAARIDREAVIQALAESGAGAEDWDDQATRLVQEFGGAPVATKIAGCFVGGCGATFTFPSGVEYQQRLDALLASDGYRAWTGGKRLSIPESLPGGRIVLAVVLYRPDERSRSSWDRGRVAMQTVTVCGAISIAGSPNLDDGRRCSTRELDARMTSCVGVSSCARTARRRRRDAPA